MRNLDSKNSQPSTRNLQQDIYFSCENGSTGRFSSVGNDQMSTRSMYQKAWNEFQEFFTEDNFKENMPSEGHFITYFKYLRNDKKLATSTIWTTYSKINSVIKSKFGRALQEFPRVAKLIKSFNTDIKKKAAIFSPEDLQSFTSNPNLNSPYWLVRKVIAIVATFGGLRQIECMDLELEKFCSKSDGIYITHSRAKQRTDKRTTKFLVPRSTDDNHDYAR